MPSISFARDRLPLRNRAFLKLPLRPRIEIFDMLLAGYLLSKRRRNRTIDMEYSNLVDSMHAKCRHRLCDGKIVSIYFHADGRNKYLRMKPLHGRKKDACFIEQIVGEV